MTSQTDSKTIWRLRRGMDRRFRTGHPWVYSNELMESPKGITPGSKVELHDAGGKYLASGYGNPQSLIAFRVLSRDTNEKDPTATEAVVKSLSRARKLRSAAGFSPFSYRLCYGEADALPGLVIDRYALEEGQVFVVQAHSAGADQISSRIVEILKIYVETHKGDWGWDKTGVVLRNDLSVRKLEGLKEEEPRILKQLKGHDFSSLVIRVRSVLDNDSHDSEAALSFRVDLIEGQKTGFFLDQFANIQLAALRFKHLIPKDHSSPLRILDLCSYVGQWSVQLGSYFRHLGFNVEVLAVDASKRSLELAQQNCESHGIQCKTWKADVLKDLSELSTGGFDIVISDPPALIKNRKDIPVGTHAYLQLNTQALRLVRPGGGIVCCSCSALLDEESFSQTLSKAAQRNQETVQWIGRGAQSPDHPMLLEFPEGRYLKSWMGQKCSK